MTAGGEDPYPEQLEEVLNQRSLGIQFSVINKAIPSTTSSMIVLQLEKNILKYKPRMVVAMMGINDEGAHMLYAQAPFPKAFSWVKHFRTYKLLRLIWLRAAIKIKQYLSLVYSPLKLQKCYAENVNFMQGRDTSNKPGEVNSKDEAAYIELGRSYVRQGNYLQGEKVIKKALELNPHSDSAYAVLEEAYVELGKSYVRQGNYLQGEKVIKKALELNPHSDSAYVALAWAYNREGNFSQAEESFKKSLELNPSNDDAYLWRGRMYSDSLNDKVQAVVFFQKAIELNPRNADACIELAGIYVAEGKYIQAKELLSKLITIAPEEERVQRALVVLNAEINRHNSGKILFDNITGKFQKSYKLMTYQSYLKLKQILDSYGIQLVCIQYPVRNIEPLKKIFEGQEGVIFVDNERVFKDALEKAPYKDYFIDMFAGDFGHCTHRGNRLLAENIANVITKDYFHIR